MDAIAEGAESSEARQLSLIESQLDTVDYLRPVAAPVRGPRVVYSGDSRIAAVYAYGRRGLLGLRPRGYVVIRRAPVVAYRGTPPLESYGYPYRDGVRQPIGHESLQTGPNRWEYRPLYADDDLSFDETHRQIEERLGPQRDAPAIPQPPERPNGIAADSRSQRSTAQRDAASEPEELPIPDQPREPPRGAKSTKTRAAARDIARESEVENDSRDNTKLDAEAGPKAPLNVPPPPKPDPAVQPTRSNVEGSSNVEGGNAREKAGTRTAQQKLTPRVGNAAEARGPDLRNPSTGTREF
jgi:hypothetical protein